MFLWNHRLLIRQPHIFNICTVHSCGWNFNVFPYSYYTTGHSSSNTALIPVVDISRSSRLYRTDVSFAEFHLLLRKFYPFECREYPSVLQGKLLLFTTTTPNIVSSLILRFSSAIKYIQGCSKRDIFQSSPKIAAQP